MFAWYLLYNGTPASRHDWITVITKKLATIGNTLINEEMHKNLEAQQVYN